MFIYTYIDDLRMMLLKI